MASKRPRRFTPPPPGPSENIVVTVVQNYPNPNIPPAKSRLVRAPFGGRLAVDNNPDRNPPLIDQIVPCAAAEVAADGGLVRLVEPLNVIALTPDADGRLALPELCVYVQMADDGADGTYDFSVEIRADPDAPLPHAPVEPLRATFGKREGAAVRSVGHVFRVRDLRFDGPGVYFVFALCGRGVMDGGPSYPTRPAKLRVVRA